MEESAAEEKSNGIDGKEWRALLSPICRQKIGDQIMETLKKRFPISGHEELVQLQKIAASYEEEIYIDATSLKTSMKMLTMENKPQRAGATNSSPSNSAGGIENPSDPDMGMPAAQGVSNGIVSNDLQALFFPNARQKIINKIMVMLKHLPISGPQGLLELEKIVVRFEEKIYINAKSQMMNNIVNLPPFDEATNSVNAIWTHEQENFFIELMVSKIRANPNRQTLTFNKEEWKEMRIDFYHRFGKKYDNKQFKNKHHHLKQRWSCFSKLLKEASGLGWDPVLQTVTAEDGWWDTYLKINPQASKFRKAGCPEYDQLCLIFGDTTASGHLQASHKHTFDIIDVEYAEEAIAIEENLAKSVPSTSLPSNPLPLTQVGVCRSRHRSRTPPSISRRGRRESNTNDLSSMIRFVAEATHRREDQKDKYSIEAVMQILEEMTNELDDRVYFKVIELLQQQGWRETFILMPDHRRRALLLRIQEDCS
ncbi:uncharacterized protein LOC131232608 isoform X2 [Magnolia sinica]|uniref:uncharacterized protein LOC131232608 isoform X2 n=1 Tax=Magnolia sinica TaxID=86752 RepID=UPI002659E4C6|nr:uncharacterized protein LOC131232608 isoform X2 [Magnolia sinica]